MINIRCESSLEFCVGCIAFDKIHFVRDQVQCLPPDTLFKRCIIWWNNSFTHTVDLAYSITTVLWVFSVEYGNIICYAWDFIWLQVQMFIQNVIRSPENKWEINSIFGEEKYYLFGMMNWERKFPTKWESCAMYVHVHCIPRIVWICITILLK